MLALHVTNLDSIPDALYERGRGRVDLFNEALRVIQKAVKERKVSKITPRPALTLQQI